MNIFKKPYWPPYIAGILIGLLQIPIFLILHASLGTSGSFGSVACSFRLWLGHIGTKHIFSFCFAKSKQWWQFGFVIGTILGAYISSRMSHMQRKSFSPVWTKAVTIHTLPTRMFMAFGGGFIMLIGALLADGCTSGNGISGISLLSVGSMIVIASMFVGGIMVSMLYKKI